MTRVSAELSDHQSPSRQPLNKNELRVVAWVCCLGIVFGAVVGYLVVPQWDLALACGLLAVPGGLLAGALAVALQRRGVGEQTTTRQKIVSLSFIALVVAAEIGLQSIVPSMTTRLLILTFVPACIAAAYRLYKRITARL